MLQEMATIYLTEDFLQTVEAVAEILKLQEQ